MRAAKLVFIGLFFFLLWALLLWPILVALGENLADNYLLPPPTFQCPSYGGPNGDGPVCGTQTTEILYKFYRSDTALILAGTAGFFGLAFLIASRTRKHLLSLLFLFLGASQMALAAWTIEFHLMDLCRVSMGDVPFSPPPPICQNSWLDKFII